MVSAALCFFFFKQKTAYEMRISDWSSDVCSSDLAGPDDERVDAKGQLIAPGLVDLGVFAIDKPAFHFGGITRAALMPDQSPPLDYPARVGHKIGRAPCRERGCQDV